MKRFNQKGKLQRILESANDSLDVPKLMKLNRKSKLQRIVESATDSLDVPKSIKTGLPGVGGDTAKKAGLVAAGVAGVTAGSAGISSIRRRGGEATGD
jgi:hypothetical protein